MARQLGVLVAIVSLVATASADNKAAHKPKPKVEATKPADVAPADGSADAAPTPEQVEAQMPPHINGPKLVDLGSDSEIDLPDGMVLFERAEAQKLVQQGGDSAESVVAAIVKPGVDWAIVIEHEDPGYIDDSDASELDAGEMLKQYQEGTAAQNQKRRQLGVPDLFIDGWSELPRYEKAAHHLVWGLNGHTTSGPVVNFFTRVLGRNGFLSIDLIASPAELDNAKVEAVKVLTATRFKAGARYDDHKGGDKDSGIGLRALVLGGAGIAVLKVAKAGILIKLLLVFKKALIFIVAGVAGFFRWLFGRGKKKADGGVPPTDPTASPPPSV